MPVTPTSPAHITKIHNPILWAFCAARVLMSFQCWVLKSSHKACSISVPSSMPLDLLVGRPEPPPTCCWPSGYLEKKVSWQGSARDGKGQNRMDRKQNWMGNEEWKMGSMQEQVAFVAMPCIRSYHLRQQLACSLSRFGLNRSKNTGTVPRIDLNPCSSLKLSGQYSDLYPAGSACWI